MSEVLDLHESPFWKERVAYLQTWYKCPWKDCWTWDSKDSWTETKEQQREWSYSSAKRAQSAPTRRLEVTNEERKTNPVETPRPWKDLGAVNKSPEFLFPEMPESQCPVSKPTSIWIGSNLESRTSTRRMKACTVPSAT